ncbi:MAG TPA: TonB-dependent receptor [Gemmatimonadaceae bacterium]|nr:TonB-dependent receptor [Gemmatimonadaceae bacterium]
MASARHRWILTGSIFLCAATARAQVDTIPADSIVPTTPVSSLSQLLTGRVNNASIVSYDGSAGVGPAVILRGPSGPSVFSGPLVVIDGVRATATTSQDIPFDTGHPGTSRLDDIDPATIENVEILPGPAASARFGPDAGNGAILVTLRHAGSMPATGWLSAEGGRTKTPIDWRSNFYAWGHTPTGDTIEQCQTYQRATGHCVVDSVTHVNLLAGPNAPFRTADEQRYTGGLSAGGRGARISLGGVYDYEPGTLVMQPFQVATFQNDFGRAPSNAQQYPSSFSRGNLHGALGFDLGKRLDVGGSVAYAGSNQRSADINNLLLDGATSPGYLGTNQGWYPSFGPARIFFDTPTQRDVHLTSNVQAHWRPADPLIFHATLGSDAVDQRSADVQDVPGSSQFPEQHVTQTDREKRTQYTVDIGAAITAGSADKAYSVLTFGGQYLETHLFDRTRSANTAGQLYSYSFSNFQAPERTQSYYLDEALTFAGRVTIDGGLRWDHQRFHEEHVNATSLNPTINASWVLVGNVADPRLRLRGAFGQTTTLTDPNILLAAFQSSIFAVPRSVPERDRELEGGFDINGKGGQWSLGGTIYARRNINASLPTYVYVPGLSNPVGSFRAGNIISNRGAELTLSGLLVSKPDVKWDATLLASVNYNKLLRNSNNYATYLGALRDQTGYPLFGVWANRYTYADSNNDGVIESTEVTSDPNASYLGSSTPTHRAALSSTMRLIKGHLRLSTVFDYRGGYALPDAPTLWRATFETDRATNEPGASLAAQARDIAILQTGVSSAGVYQRVSALRWRELAATIGPTTGKRFDITVAARNLALWSGYRGGDPDQDVATSTLSTYPAMHLPQPLTWILRVTAGF